MHTLGKSRRHGLAMRQQKTVMTVGADLPAIDLVEKGHSSDSHSAASDPSVGVRAVLVHAIDLDAVPFYTRYGFHQFPVGTQSLFFSMEEVIASL
jgi:hypothetical protein